MTARRGSAADALARMQRAATTGSPITRTPDATLAADLSSSSAPAGAVSTSPRTRPTRTTVDLDPARHRALRLYAADHGVRNAEVIRALIDALTTDPALKQAIADRLANDRDSLR